MSININIMGGFVNKYEHYKFGTPTEESIYYKIKLEDGVDAKEFLEKYRIVDSNGDVYIIEERE